MNVSEQSKSKKSESHCLGAVCEFVYFDADDNPESVQTIPLGRFISDTPLSSEEYFMTRSLVAAQAAK